VKATTYCLLLPRLSYIRVTLMPLIGLQAGFPTQRETLLVSFFFLPPLTVELFVLTASENFIYLNLLHRFLSAIVLLTVPMVLLNL
jgi:hypothetical protein